MLAQGQGWLSSGGCMIEWYGLAAVNTWLGKKRSWGDIIYQEGGTGHVQENSPDDDQQGKKLSFALDSTQLTITTKFIYEYVSIGSVICADW